MKATAESKCAPIDYVALGVLVTTAGVIGPKRRVSPWEGWDEPSILWGAGVGPPSVSKSPAFDPLREAVRTVERGLNADWDSKLSKFETDKSAADAHRAKWEQGVAAAVRSEGDVPVMPDEAAQPEKPTQRRLCVVNSAPEKLVRLLAENPGGLICYRDELTGLLGGFDKYGGSGADRASGWKPMEADPTGTIASRTTPPSTYPSVPSHCLEVSNPIGSTGSSCPVMTMVWPPGFFTRGLIPSPRDDPPELPISLLSWPPFSALPPWSSFPRTATQ